MTSRLYSSTAPTPNPALDRSVQKRRNGDRFEAVIWRAAAGDLPAEGRTLPRLDQLLGDLRRIEIRSDATPLTLARAHTLGESLIPTVENAEEFGAHRFTRTTKLERQVADQAAEHEVAGLVLVGEGVEEACDSFPCQTFCFKNWEKARFDIGPIMFEDRRGECLFAGKICVERPFWHTCDIGDVFDPAGGESTRVYEAESRFEQAATHVGIRWAGHTANRS